MAAVAAGAVLCALPLRAGEPDGVDWRSSTDYDVFRAMQGRYAGLTVLAPSGAPGVETAAVLRGYSLNGESPLIIVDGLRVDNLANIDPSTVESVELLKDASASVLYGEEAAEGVIIVKTRRAAAGKGVSVGYSGQYVPESLGHKPALMDAKAYSEYYGLEYDPATSADTDWIGEILGSAGWAMRHNLDVSASMRNAGVYAALGYVREDGIMPRRSDLFDRMSVQLNAWYRPFDWLEIGTANNYSHRRYGDVLWPEHVSGGYIYPFQDLLHVSMMSSMLCMSPLAEASPDAPYLGSAASNPLETMCSLEDSRSVLDAIAGTTYAEADIAGFLDFRTQVGYRFGDRSFAYDGAVRDIQWDSRVAYSHAFSRHSLAAALGYTFRDLNVEGAATVGRRDEADGVVSWTRRNTAYLDLGYAYGGTLEVNARLAFESGKHRYSSDVYRYARSYSYPAALSASLSAAWQPWEFLKFRASYGMFQRAVYADGWTDADLRPLKHLDIGADLAFFDGRLAAAVDLFDKQATYGFPVHLSDPYGRFPVDVRNLGAELGLSWHDSAGGVDYSVGANVSYLKNRCTGMPDSLDGFSGNTTYTNAGVVCMRDIPVPVWNFSGYRYIGGDEFEGAGTEIIGSGIPSWNFGFFADVSYRGFDLSVVATGLAGADIFYGTNTVGCNMPEFFASGAGTQYPSLEAQRYDNTFKASSAMVFDGSFLRIRQLQLGYTLPAHITRRAHIEKLRFFVSLDDFFTFTSYPGLDPSTALGALRPYEMGFDNGAYPTMRKAVFGVSIGL